MFGPILSDYAYTVETTAELTAPVWTALPANRPIDLGGKRFVADSTAPDARRFYRVRVAAQPPEQLQVGTAQPRLFWNPQIAANVTAKTSDRDKFFANLRRTRMANFPATPAALDRAAIAAETQAAVAGNNGTAYATTAMGYGLGAFLCANTADAPAYRTYAETYLAALCARTFTTAEGDSGPREKLFAMGLLYDWLALDGTSALDRSVHRQTLDTLQAVDDSWKYFTQPSYSGGHSRYANVCALAALLAIRHGIAVESAADRESYFRWLGRIVRNWREGYNPTNAWMSGDAGHGMGWAYGPEYTTTDPYVMWDNATAEERWTAPWVRERAQFEIYGARNNAYDETVRNQHAYDTFPYSGDVFSTAFYIPTHGAHLLHGDSPAAGWLYQQIASKYRYNYWAHLLYFDPAAATSSPDQLGLPLARAFGVSGYVLMRDTWNLAENTLLEFKSSSYYHGNHHHLDQNAFTLFFHGPLAIDSGGYNIFGGYGTTHARNYYRRSVAHNTILVYDPAEKFTSGGTACANDGGQKLATGTVVDYPTLAQMQPGGTNALDGILAFENRADFAYALGDATKAYAASKVSAFHRSIVYLRNFSGTHPVVVVHDRVVATNPAFAKTYLLHSINAPQLSGRRATITIDDGTTANRPAALIQETVLPADAAITTVGGAGREFWVADDGSGTGQGHNYNEGQSTNPDDFVALREAGKWRVEVKPGAARAADSFLHVLTVTESASAAPASVTSLSVGAGCDAVVVRRPGSTAPGTCLIFNYSEAAFDATVDLANAPAIDRLIVVGLIPDTTLDRTETSTLLRLRAGATGALRASDQGLLVVARP